MKVVADYFASFPYYDFCNTRNRNLRDLFFVVIAADQEIRKKISQICGFFQSGGSFSTDYMCVVESKTSRWCLQTIFNPNL